MQYFIVQDIVEEDSCKYHFHVACICALSDPQLRIVEERAVTLTRDLPALGYSIALSSQCQCQCLCVCGCGYGGRGGCIHHRLRHRVSIRVMWDIEPPGVLSTEELLEDEGEGVEEQEEVQDPDAEADRIIAAQVRDCVCTGTCACTCTYTCAYACTCTRTR